MGSHDPFEYLKHKLWPKEGSRPLKVENRLDFLMCRWSATYCWKALDKGYNFVLDLTLIGGLHTKLWAAKVAGLVILGTSGFPLGSLGTKWQLGVGPMARHKEYYKKEGGDFPKSGPWWVLWLCVCLWFVHAPKMFQLCTNQLVVWFVQVHVNNWFASQFS
jgi:hypothetical protein